MLGPPVEFYESTLKLVIFSSLPCYKIKNIFVNWRELDEKNPHKMIMKLNSTLSKKFKPLMKTGN
jgi:hypothetical protein